MISTPKLDWQQALIQAVTEPEELCRLLDLDPKQLGLGQAAAAQFSLKVPRGFIARMQTGNPLDPLLRQVLPLALEEQLDPAYSVNPVGEDKVNPVSGLLHKYQGRVLLTLTGVCAINCRYCFRRHFPYEANNPSQAQWEPAFRYIQEDHSIQEVILSGGDPLLLPDRILKTVSDRLNAMPQVLRLRLHTRIPVVLPERINDDFLAWLSSCSQTVIIVLHCNHPAEINEPVLAALQKLKAAGVCLLNQAVLLKGINDSLETLVALSERLFSAGVLPYYLHVLDKVQGAAHFDCALEEAKALYRALSACLPGYLLPKLVQERAGEGAKTLLGTA